jgi:hypothetical protein
MLTESDNRRRQEQDSRKALDFLLQSTNDEETKNGVSNDVAGNVSSATDSSANDSSGWA